MIGEYTLPIGGVAEGQQVAHHDHLYLLDAKGTVISCRATRGMPAVGEEFFRVLGTSVAERRALYRALEGGLRGLYLMQCGPVPVLILCHLYRVDLSLVAVILDEPLFTALRTPAAYADYLFAEVLLSPFSAARQMPFSEEICLAARDWMLPYVRAIAHEGCAKESAATLGQWLTLRTVRWANLIGVQAFYDFSGMGYAPVEDIDCAVLGADLLALLLACKRASSDGSLYLAAERDGYKAPTVYARFLLAGDALPPELEAAKRTSLLRGMRFSAYTDPTRKGLLHLRFSFCGAPIDLQELRNRFMLS